MNSAGMTMTPTPCPVCRATLLVAGVCASCGYSEENPSESGPPTGGRVARAADVSALDFEDEPATDPVMAVMAVMAVPEPVATTARSGRAVPEASPKPEAQIRLCPGCGAQIFGAPRRCGACGLLLRMSRKGADDEERRCGACGVRNARSLAKCRNCGLVLR